MRAAGPRGALESAGDGFKWVARRLNAPRTPPAGQPAEVVALRIEVSNAALNGAPPADQAVDHVPTA
jgi:hypothetical protein